MDMFWLSLVQGLTEFFPISSSAHLIVVSRLLDLPSFNRSIEVALNSITVLVTLLYFRKDIFGMVGGILRLCMGSITEDFHRFLKLCYATLPIIGAGYIVYTYFDSQVHLLKLMGWMSILFGVLLILVDRLGRLDKTYKQMKYRDAFLIGCFQIISLIPGTSRAGVTLIAGRLLGYQRREAARFSFLLSIPTSLGAVTLLAKKIFESNQFTWGIDLIVLSGATFLVGYLALSFFMWWVKKHTFALWGLYRIVFGTFILWYFS